MEAIRKSVYGLLCPDTLICRYVGVAANVDKRYKQHCRISENIRSSTFRTTWLSKLIQNGKKPLLIILEKDSDDFYESETNWVKYYRHYSGELLTNGNDGGHDLSHAHKSSKSNKSTGTRTRVAIALQNMKWLVRHYKKINDSKYNYAWQRYAKSLQLVKKLRKEGRLDILERRLKQRENNG